MPYRKPWSKEYDRILKYLKEYLDYYKWSVIARKMETDHGIVGRNGKQCREKYHNHLDSTIKHCEWTHDEEYRLIYLQQKLGNKWSLISNHMPGRTDNCVKNHFYSKLRRAFRKLNKIILKSRYKDSKQLDNSIINKLIEVQYQLFKQDKPYYIEYLYLSTSIQNKLYWLESSLAIFKTEYAEKKFVTELLRDIDGFIKKFPPKVKVTMKLELSKDHPTSNTVYLQPNYYMHKGQLRTYLYDNSVCNNYSSSSYDDAKLTVNRSKTSDSIKRKIVDKIKKNYWEVDINFPCYLNEPILKEIDYLPWKLHQGICPHSLGYQGNQDEKQYKSKCLRHLFEQYYPYECLEYKEKQYETTFKNNVNVENADNGNINLIYEENDFTMRLIPPKTPIEGTIEAADNNRQLWFSYYINPVPIYQNCVDYEAMQEYE